jgi:HK97 family phage major capsid protein
MFVRVHYEYGSDGTMTMDVSGDVQEFRGMLQQLGILDHAGLKKDHPQASTFVQLRSLYSALQGEFPLEVVESRSSRASVRDRHPVIDRHARIEQHRAVIAEHNRKHEEIFLDFLRNGKDAIPDEFRAQAVGTGSAGGFLTPQSFADRFTASLKQYDQIFDVATLLETETGTGLNFPVDDDTGAVATLVLENALSLTTSPITFDSVTFGRCPLYRSGLINASSELVNDSAFDLAGLLAGAFARRFARGVGAAFITQLLADADVAITSASPTIVTPDELMSLMGALDASYAMRGVFMSFASYIAFLKQKGSTGGSYLLEPELDSEGYPTLFGRRCYLSPSMPGIAALGKAIAFGDATRFVRRQVRGSLAVRVFVERYAELGQVAFESYLRVDGKTAKAANSPLPIRLLQCHA